MAKVHKGAGTKVAKLPEVQPHLDAAANLIRTRAAARAAGSMRTGAYSRAFKVRKVRGKKGVIDRLVENDHPDSFAIEHGHWSDSDKNPTWVPGRRDLWNAIGGAS